LLPQVWQMPQGCQELQQRQTQQLRSLQVQEM
jgi:hypothetical protein